MINRVVDVDDYVPIANAIVSVADKRGLAELARSLIAACPAIRFYSTGGTYAFLSDALGASGSARLSSISDYTGQPEMQGGLVKTLDFKIYLGLLSEPYNEAHAADLRRTGAVAFDLVISNLYPFEESAAKTGATVEDARANIDIGGVTLLRAAAKNFLRVAVVSDPSDYGELAEELARNEGRLSLKRRFALAQKAFAHTAAYDAAIARYLRERAPSEAIGSYALRGKR